LPSAAIPAISEQDGRRLSGCEAQVGDVRVRHLDHRAVGGEREADQQPDDPDGRLSQGVPDRPALRLRARIRCARVVGAAGVAVREQAEVLGPVHDDEPDQRGDQYEGHDAEERRRRAPAELFDEPRGDVSHHEAREGDADLGDAERRPAAPGEPVDDQRRVRDPAEQRHAERDQHAEAEVEVPDRGGSGEPEEAGREEGGAEDHQAPDRAPVHLATDERTRDPPDDPEGGKAEADQEPGAAQILCQWLQQDPVRVEDRAHHHELGEERDRDDRPAVEEALGGLGRRRGLGSGVSGLRQRHRGAP
jgi:hypothetical protein